MKKYVHIDTIKIRSNIKKKKADPKFEVDPVVIVRTKSKVLEKCHEVEIQGPCKVVYAKGGAKILNCGARVTIETESPIRVIR
jgi:hypothetical protein